jgi:hypothetical protein
MLATGTPTGKHGHVVWAIDAEKLKAPIVG